MKKILLVLTFISLNLVAQTTSGLQLDAFLKTIKAQKTKNIIDVRSPQEWAEGKISSAKTINWRSADFIKEANKLDKNTPVFLYCAAGVRAGQAATALKQQGFNQVYFLQGGGYADLADKSLK